MQVVQRPDHIGVAGRPELSGKRTEHLIRKLRPNCKYSRPLGPARFYLAWPTHGPHGGPHTDSRSVLIFIFHIYSRSGNAVWRTPSAPLRYKTGNAKTRRSCARSADERAQQYAFGAHDANFLRIDFDVLGKRAEVVAAQKHASDLSPLVLLSAWAAGADLGLWPLQEVVRGGVPKPIRHAPAIRQMRFSPRRDRLQDRQQVSSCRRELVAPARLPARWGWLGFN